MHFRQVEGPEMSTGPHRCCFLFVIANHQPSLFCGYLPLVVARQLWILGLLVYKPLWLSISTTNPNLVEIKLSYSKYKIPMFLGSIAGLITTYLSWETAPNWSPSTRLQKPASRSARSGWSVRAVPPEIFSEESYQISIYAIEHLRVIYIYIHTYIHTYTHTHIHTYIHTLHTYIHTFHTYIHTHTYITWHDMTWRYVTLRYITLHTYLHYITLHHITLHYIHTYITLHYITLHTYLHYITLHHITSHHITLHYITYIHIHRKIH